MTDERTVSHEDATVAAMARDPEFAQEYLSLALAEGDESEFATALGRLIRAQGAMRSVADMSSLNVQTLYRTLSRNGNPELRTLRRILSAIGYQLAVVPMSPPEVSDIATVAGTILPQTNYGARAATNVVQIASWNPPAFAERVSDYSVSSAQVIPLLETA